MRGFLAACLLAHFCVGATDARAEGPAREVVARFPTAVAWDLAQTRDGYVWAATTAGLVRLDGLRTVMAPELGVPAVPVRRVAALRDGSLLVATGGGYLGGVESGAFTVSYREGPGRVLRLRPPWTGAAEEIGGLTSPWAWAFAEDERGRVFVGTEAGVCRLRAGNVERCFGPAEGITGAVSALVPAADGVWVATGAGVLLLGEERAVPTALREAVWAMSRAADGEILALTEGAIVAARSGRVVSRFSSRTLSALVVGPDGTWVAGERIGTLDAAGDVQQVSVPGAEAGVASMMLDREGGLWLGLRAGGLALLRAPTLRNFGPPEGLPGTAAFGVHPAAGGGMWLATNAGIVRWDGARFRLIHPPTAGFPRGLAVGPDGILWVADGPKLLRVVGERVQELGPADGIRRGGVRSVYVDRKSGLWVGWDDIGDGPDERGVTHFPGGRIVPGKPALGPGDGLCGSDIATIHEGPTGTMWFGTSSEGLTRLSEGRARCFTTKDGLPSNTVFGVREDDDGTTWVAVVSEVGLARLRGDRVFAYGPSTGMLPGGLLSLADDGRGHLWATSRNGVVRIDKASLHAVADGKRGHVRWHRVGADDGMRSPECMAAISPGGALDEHGAFWAPTLAGVSVIADPDRLPAARAVPVFEALVVDGHAVPLERAGSLGPGVRSLEVRYAAPSFVAPSRLVLEHRLVGVDATFTASTARSARWASLGPGAYRFELRVPGERVVGLDLFIRPSFFERRPVQLSLVGLLLMLSTLSVFWAGRLRLARQAARHAALNEERARIARDLHDGLAQGFHGLRYHLDAIDLTAGSNDKLKELTDRAREILDHTHAESRIAVWDLRATSDRRRNLDEVVRGVAERARRENGVVVELRREGRLPARAALLEHELPRILEEAITNAVRHGRAKRVAVTLVRGADGLLVTVDDDGSGLPGSPSGGGFGIMGMQERAMRLGGTLTVEPGKAGGVRVALAIPEQAMTKMETT